MKHTLVLALVPALALAACSGKPKGTTTPPTGGGSGGGTASDGGGVMPDAAPVVSEPTPDAALPEPDPHEALMAAEMDAYEKAKPVFAKSCGGCHIQGGAQATAKKLAHLDLTNYPFGGHHVDTITTTIRHVLGVDGAKPTMPKNKPGSVKGDDLAAIVAWAEAYDAAEKGGAHPAHEHHHDDDDDDDDHH